MFHGNQLNETEICPPLAPFQLGTCRTRPLNSTVTVSGFAAGMKTSAAVMKGRFYDRPSARVASVFLFPFASKR
jgi:hypothetical protein